MKRLAPLAALAIAGCAPAPVSDNAVTANAVAPEPTPSQPPAPGPVPAPPASGRYKCIDGSRIGVAFHPDRAVITQSGKALVLKREPVASGIRYAAGGTSFAGKAELMTFTQPDLPPLPCSPIRR